eukprot:10483851-Prorocentrum_lima.AAC.1
MHRGPVGAILVHRHAPSQLFHSVGLESLDAIALHLEGVRGRYPSPRVASRCGRGHVAPGLSR